MRILSLKDKIQRVGQSILSLLYPPLCLHCGDLLDDPSIILCLSCSEMLDLINPKLRCPYCFSDDYCLKRKICPKCIKKPSFLTRSATCFEYIGPAKTIIEKMKNSNQPYLSMSASAFMLTQFYQLNWPKPDLVIPVPQSLKSWISRGYNQSELLGLGVAKYLNTPCINAMHSSSLNYKQSSLNRKKRGELTDTAFSLLKNQNLQDKNILVVDDIIYSGATLKSVAKTLMAGFPKAIFGLTFCRY